MVGRDVTTSYPPEAYALPNLGHISQLNPEAILELSPDYIFIEEEQVGQTEALAQLQQSGIEVVAVPTRPSLDNALHASKVIGKYLEVPGSAVQIMAQKIEKDSLRLAEQIANKTTKPSVLFIYARGAGRLMVGGRNTDAAVMIEKAGGKNAMQSFDDYRVLTAEGLLEAAPEVILMFKSGLESLDGKAGLAQIPGIQQTPAWKNDRIITMDGHLLTAFGPRAGEAALELEEALRVAPQ